MPRINRTRTGSSLVAPLSMVTLLLTLMSGLVGCAPNVKELRQQAVEQYRGRQYIESMATLREVLEIKRTDPEANYYMGLNYRAMAARKFRDDDIQAARRELDTALLYFTEAVKSWPNYMVAVDAKTEAFEARGKYDEALAVAKYVAKNNQGAWEHFLVLGNEYRERGDHDNALRCYKVALSTAPNAAMIYSAMGQLYLRTGDRALAMDTLRRAHELNKSEPGVAEALAQINVDSDTVPASHRPATPPPQSPQP